MLISAELQRALTPRLTKYVRVQLTAKQTAFLLLPHLEAFYGGAAGGGKSFALLMAALQYADIPGYAAILFRRTYSDLALPGALMDVAANWLRGTDARWHEKEKTWTFPSSATLTFGYLESESDKFRYQSAAFQFIGFDELTQFSESQYTFLFSRLRRPKTGGAASVPLRMRAASNPGGEGHTWVRERFVAKGHRRSRVFIAARLDDNPHLDRESYIQSLAELDPVTREQLLNGDWLVTSRGRLFRREWFQVVDQVPSDNVMWVRFWDFAATEPQPQRGRSGQPDYSAGVRVGLTRQGQYYISNVQRGQLSPHHLEQLVQQTAQLDGVGVSVWLEQEGGAAGKITVASFQTRVLPGFACRGLLPQASKVERARVVSSAAEAGNVFLLRGPWNAEYLEEMAIFPYDRANDDQVDATSGAFQALAQTSGATGFVR